MQHNHVVRLGWSRVYVRQSSDGLVLIDAGPDYAGAWESLCQQLAQFGADARDVRDVLITHAHIDHAGLAARWQAAGAQVWIGAGDATALEAGEQGVAALRAESRTFFSTQGVPEELFRRDHSRVPSPPGAPSGAMFPRGENHHAEWIGAAPEPSSPQGKGAAADLRRGRYDHAAHWPSALCWQPARADGFLHDGDTLAGLQVIACPGHTPGSVALFDEAAGQLYTGDHLLPGSTPPPGLTFGEGRRLPSLTSWLASLLRLRDLPVATVLPGHGEPFGDLQTVVDRNIAHIEQQARRVLRLIRCDAATSYELVQRLYPHLPAGLRWFKLAEVVNLLDLLSERQAVAVRQDGRYATN